MPPLRGFNFWTALTQASQAPPGRLQPGLTYDSPSRAASAYTCTYIFFLILDMWWPWQEKDVSTSTTKLDRHDTMKNAIIKTILSGIIFIFLFYGGIELYKFANRSFSLKNITEDHLSALISALKISPPTLSPDDEIFVQTLFKKTFSYLGKGHQTYAFVSDDSQYVIKFFNFHRLNALEPVEWLPSLPLLIEYQKHIQQRRQKKFNRLFEGYKIAYEKDREGTGVVYVHFQKTSHLKSKILITDSLNRPYLIDLDDTIFVVQKKVNTAREVLTRLLDQGNTAEFTKRIAQLLHLYLAEYRLGLFDSDHNILSNTGFLKDRAYRIDVGRLTYKDQIKDPKNYRPDIKKIIDKRILKWVHHYYPSYYDELSRELNSQLNAIQVF